MLNRANKTILFLGLCMLIIAPGKSFAWHGYYSDGDWDYHGSGRDHAYSEYIDRYYYIGPADYAPIPPDFYDAPLVLTPMPAPVPLTTLPVTQVQEFPVNIPDTRTGGYITVVIKKDGDSYVGPKGEHYPDFPKIFQLEMKYGSS